MQTITDYFSAGWGAFFIMAFLTIVSFSDSLPKIFKTLSKRKNQISVSILLLLIGAIHVSFHSTWNTGLEKTISSLGYISILKGLTLFVFPGTLKVSEQLTKSNFFTLFMIIVLFSGLFFITAALN